MKRYNGLIGCLILGIASCFFACTEIINGDPPPNPFDIEHPEPPMPVPPPDSNTIVGIHQYILTQSCNVPGCHDGSFEPDYRTVQSTYSTLVFHPVIKNNSQGSFEYRVLPNDVDKSWLYERVTTDDQTLGRMPLYDDPLTEGQLRSIREWIDAGAPDMFGNVSALTNTQPQFSGAAAFINFGGLDYRVDTIRDETFSPFGTLNNVDLTIYFAVNDDSTGIGDLSDTEVVFSDDYINYSNPVKHTPVYASTPKVVEDFYGENNDGYFFWSVTVNTGDFPVNAVTFFRYIVADGDHPEPLIFPQDEQALGLKLYMSFYVAQ